MTISLAIDDMALPYSQQPAILLTLLQAASSTTTTAVMADPSPATSQTESKTGKLQKVNNGLCRKDQLRTSSTCEYVMLQKHATNLSHWRRRTREHADQTL